MIMTKYLVVEDAYNYNDEYYYHEEGYTIKSRLFDNEIDAIAEAQKLNQEIRDSDMAEWFRVEDSDEPIQPFHVIEIEE